jgi:hypothetical protein
MRYKLTLSTLAFAVSVCANAQSAAPLASVPDSLKPDTKESVTMVLAARGVQIYECVIAKDKADAYEWSFVAPEAELFDATGKKVGKHGAGPTWEAADGSKIVGTVKERADASQADAIAWLLLTAKSVGAQGVFSTITSVQRVNTVGGAAPHEGCSRVEAGTVARVPYSADYYFLASDAEVPSPFNASAHPVVQPRAGYSY